MYYNDEFADQTIPLPTDVAGVLDMDKLPNNADVIYEALQFICAESRCRGEPVKVKIVPLSTGKPRIFDEHTTREEFNQSAISDRYGYFSFVNCESFYGMSSHLAPIQRQRLMYLMAFADKNGVLQQERKPIAPNRFKEMTVDQWVMDLFDIKPQAERNLMTDLCSVGAIAKQANIVSTRSGSEACNAYQFSRDLLYKGKRTQNERDLTEGGQSRYIRLFETAVRQLYRSPSAREVMKYLPLIILCVNSHNNVLCYNPLESDPSLVETISFQQACELMEYPKGGMSRIRKAMLETTFHTPFNGYEHVCIQTDREVLGLPAGSYFINPRIYTGAGNDSIMELAPLFKAKERKT